MAPQALLSNAESGEIKGNFSRVLAYLQKLLPWIKQLSPGLDHPYQQWLAIWHGVWHPRSAETGFAFVGPLKRFSHCAGEIIDEFKDTHFRFARLVVARH